MYITTYQTSIITTAYNLQVTIVTPYSPARTIPNVREILIEENDIAPLMPNPFTDGDLSPILNVMQKGPEMCFRALASPIIADVLNEKYDLAFVSLFFCECFVPHIASKQVNKLSYCIPSS